jgi:hypothetical protein
VVRVSKSDGACACTIRSTQDLLNLVCDEMGEVSDPNTDTPRFRTKVWLSEAASILDVLRAIPACRHESA